jgi:hypothetical protein
MRDWNEEYQSCRELPRKSLQDRCVCLFLCGVRFSVCWIVFCGFVRVLLIVGRQPAYSFRALAAALCPSHRLIYAVESWQSRSSIWDSSHLRFPCPPRCSINRDRTLYRVHADFVDAAVKGAWCVDLRLPCLS